MLQETISDTPVVLICGAGSMNYHVLEGLAVEFARVRIWDEEVWSSAAMTGIDQLQNSLRI